MSRGWWLFCFIAFIVAMLIIYITNPTDGAENVGGALAMMMFVGLGYILLSLTSMFIGGFRNNRH